MKLRRILSLVLVLMMVLGCVFCAGLTVSAETEAADETTDYNLGYSVNDGLILQAWNWSYAEIEANLEAIAEAGFTTIQISPPTELKEATEGVKVLQEANDNGWWMMYQPAAYELNQSEDNVLGTKDELVSMIDAAHDMGLFVIADAVINHLGNSETGDYKINISQLPKDANAVDYLCERAWEFDSSKAIIEAGAFHYPYANCQYNDTGAFDCTQNAVSLLPDLDTSHPVVQETILDYWHECIDAGIDGFRIDAAKHIETKYDGEYASDFWDVLMYDGINGKLGIYPYAKETYGKDLYMYGEILNTVSTERSFTWYLEYMNITNSTAFYAICDAVNNGNAAQAVPTHFNNGMTSETAVLWDESHDTYMDGCKANNVPSVNLLTKRWACMATRADVVSMYLARPTNTPHDVYDLDLGVAYDTAWNDKETAVINKFHNHFQGAGEAVSSSGNIAIIERADSGVVLVNCKGNNADVSVPAKALADGTYIDQMTGNVFTCKDGVISGSIGSTGVAVVYNPETPVVAASRESSVLTTDSFTVDIVANGTGEEFVYGILGDADNSATVNVKDATAIQKAVAGIELVSYNVNVADVDSSTSVNVKDATAIQKWVAGIDTGFAINEVLMSDELTPEAYYQIDDSEPVAFSGKKSLEMGINDYDTSTTLTLSCGDYTKTYTYTFIMQENANWVKFDNSETQWPQVYCYAYVDGVGQNNAWPGILMKELEDDIWYYEIPEELVGATVVFSDNILGTGKQTGNLPTKDKKTGDLHSKHFIFTGDIWNAIGEDGAYTEIGEERAEYYIVFADTYNWKSKTVYKLRYYATGGGPAMTSPGLEMEFIGTDENGVNLYGAYIDRNYTTIKFYCTNKSNIVKETSDVYVTGNCGYYPLASSGGPACGTFEVTPPVE
ncbi:MAG: starch-binding protein [Ruminococcus sp.]|nr:starch-binding protein [Ruminococcus sp.]